jgi:RHS repeat-associated protein
MPGGRAAGKAAEGIIAKAVKDLLRTTAKDGARDGARAAARDGARDAARTAARDAERAAARDAERAAARDGERDAARSLAGRTTRVDPVDVASGEVVLRQVDVELPGVLPLLLERTHISSYRDGGWFGPSWASTLDQRVEASAGGVRYFAPDGARLFYPRVDGELAALPTYGPRHRLGVGEAGYTIARDDGQLLCFGQGDGALAAIVDRNGNRIEVDRDGEAIQEVRHSAGHRIGVRTSGGRIAELRLGELVLARFGYDEGGRLVEVADAGGRPLSFGYDDAGRLTGWQDRAGTEYAYGYDEAGRCVRTHGTGGYLAATFAYGDGVTEVTDSLGNRTAYHLDEHRRVVREVDPLGHATTTERDSLDRVTRRTDPLGRTTSYSYDDAGNLAALTRPDGRQVSATHGPHGRPVTITEADGTAWHRAYDERGNLVAVTDPAGATTTYRYGDRGELTAIADALGHTWRVHTDPGGLPVRVTDPLGATTSYERDPFGRVTAVTDPLGNRTRYGWTATSKLAWRANPDGAGERWSYDGEGNVTSHADLLGQVTSTEVGPFDLPASRTGVDGGRIAYGYDTERRLVSVTNQQGLLWRYEYDPAGRLSREVDFNGRVLSYRHDAAGQLIERTNGAGESVAFSRDALGNIVEQRAGDALTTFAYDPAGRVVRAANAEATVVFERDPRGRVVAERCNGLAVESGYDLLGRRIRRRTPTGTESAWEYDPNRRPVALHTGGTTLRFGYDPAGREVARRIGADQLLTQAWDANSRLVSQTVGAVGAVASGAGGPDRRYAYRADGLLRGVEDRHGGGRTVQLDPAGRIVAVDGPGWSERYGYDGAGNLSDARWPLPGGADSPGTDSLGADSPGTDSIGAYSLGEREYAGSLISRAGGVRFEHDRQGRLVRRRHRTLSGQTREWRYDWDAQDRLRSVTTPQGQSWRYRYDPFGRRIAKEGPGERTDFIWDGVLLAEQAHTAGAGWTTSTWDWDGLRPVAQLDRTVGAGERSYAILTDPIGTPTGYLPMDGAAGLAAGPASAWGVPLADLGGHPLRFPGQYADRESGLNYNSFRYYEPTLGRYLSADPAGLAGGANPHAYVHNPMCWLDPFGLTACPTEDAVQLFRNVDEREFNEIARTGRFGTGEGQMEGKWFALEGEHAEQWGQLLNRGEGITVETRIPRSLADTLHSHPGKLDGIGPGMYANGEQLEQINHLMDGIRVWP